MDADTAAVGDTGPDGVASDAAELLAGETDTVGETGVAGAVQPARSTMVASQAVRGNATPHRYIAAGAPQ